MANVFIKAQQVVDAAALLLYRELVLARTITTMGSDKFVGALNDTVTMRVPSLLTARTRALRSTTGLTADSLTETSVPVQLDTHIYSLLNLTDEELSLDIVDFSQQVLLPQMRAVAEGIDTAIATEIAGATPTSAVITAAPTDKLSDLLVDAGVVLNTANVPRGDRVAIVGSLFEARAIKELGNRQTSLGDSAIQDATLGSMSGLTLIGSNAVAAKACYVYHRSAFAGATMAPALPDGATMKARTALNGFALRFIKDYNPSNSTGPVDRSLVDAFAGYSPVNDGAGSTNRRMVKITLP